MDEFLAAGVPIQLGGLHDPFSPREQRHQITYQLLRVLKDTCHPTLISTKGELVVEPSYISLLQDMNAVVRFSAAGVAEKFRAAIDRRCSAFQRTIEKIGLLSRRGIRTGLRIQPVIPGFEEDALRMAREAAAAGASRVSFEYLKLPSESLQSDCKRLSDILGFDILKHMKALGLTNIGWDYSLASLAKKNFVLEARRVCHEAHISFGAGDTEFIPLSDGDGCCGSSSEFVSGSKQFQANFVGAIKFALNTPTRRVTFDHLEQVWSPQKPVSTYLNARSRAFSRNGRYSDWLSLMARRWNGNTGPYSPKFFSGVEWSGEIDSRGFYVYDATKLSEMMRITDYPVRSFLPVTPESSKMAAKASSNV